MRDKNYSSHGTGELYFAVDSVPIHLVNLEKSGIKKSEQMTKVVQFCVCTYVVSEYQYFMIS